MLTWEYIWPSIIACILYVVFCRYQRIFLKGSYFSVQDIVFSTNRHKAILALASRFLYILFITFVLSSLLQFPRYSIVYGISFGSFLLTWPSIYMYRLAFHCRNKVKRNYFLGCLMSIWFTYSAVILSYDFILPSLRGTYEISFLGNTGWQLILSILGVVVPNPLNAIMRKNVSEHAYYGECDTFEGDLRILENRIHLEYEFINDKIKFIQAAAKKYDIPEKLLFIVLSIERINRDIAIVRIAEWLICRISTWMAYKMNLSVGIAQLSIPTVKRLTNDPLETFVMKLFDDEYSIYICARYLKALIDTYFATPNAEILELEKYEVTETQNVFEYITKMYLTGSSTSEQRFLKVYSAILEGNIPELDQSNG